MKGLYATVTFINKARPVKTNSLPLPQFLRIHLLFAVCLNGILFFGEIAQAQTQTQKQDQGREEASGRQTLLQGGDLMQGKTQKMPDTENVWLPLAGYDSDTGFALGTIGRSFVYKQDYSPYYRSFSARAMATTKGFYTVDLELDHLQTAGTRLRSLVTLFAERFQDEPYFGTGNFTQVDPQRLDEGYYEFERREFGLLYEGSLPLTGSPLHRRLQLLILADARMDDSRAGSSNTLFSSEGLEVGSHIVLLPGIGIRFDTRNNEIIPTKGIFAELRFQTSVATDQQDFQLVKGSLKGFHPVWTMPLFGEVTLAQHLQFEFTHGDVPHWLQPRLGSRDGLRGVYLNRYQGSGSWLYMAELRSWFLEWKRADLRLGGQFFWDMGRVFGGNNSIMGGMDLPASTDASALFSHIRTSYGFGGVLGVGSENFFLRMDVGFSDETSRVYVGAGYAF